MIDLYFNVDSQKISEKPNNVKVIKGTKNLLQLNFSFSDEWNGMVVVALFGNEYVAIKKSKCMVPNSLTDRPIIKFKLVGKKDDVIITTNEYFIRQGV